MDPRILSVNSEDWHLFKEQGAMSDSVDGRPWATAVRDHITASSKGAGYAWEQVKQFPQGIRHLHGERSSSGLNISLKVGVKVSPSEGVLQVQRK